MNQLYLGFDESNLIHITLNKHIKAVPFMFGLLGSSLKFLYVLNNLLCLTDDILSAGKGGIFLTLLF